jgi:hypothetical protein
MMDYFKYSDKLEMWIMEKFNFFYSVLFLEKSFKKIFKKLKVKHYLDKISSLI